MMSQSIVSYRLLQCIVSAAQFARGELTFYPNTVELVAEDHEGQTTSPLALEYDAILHFRVLRNEHFVRITVPRPLVQPWAGANGFLSQLDLPTDAHSNTNRKTSTHGGDTNDKLAATAGAAGHEVDEEATCDLLGQLDKADFDHFLATVAPMVAATRRGRSRSRLSMTDPLPVGCYVPEPTLTAAAAETMSNTNEEEAEDDGGTKDEGSNATLAAAGETTRNRGGDGTHTQASSPVKYTTQEEGEREQQAVQESEPVHTESSAALPSQQSPPQKNVAEEEAAAAAASSQAHTTDSTSGKHALQAQADSAAAHTAGDAAERLSVQRTRVEQQLNAAVAALETSSEALPHLIRPARTVGKADMYYTTGKQRQNTRTIATRTTATATRKAGHTAAAVVYSQSVSPSLTSTHTAQHEYTGTNAKRTRIQSEGEEDGNENRRNEDRTPVKKTRRKSRAAAPAVSLAEDVLHTTHPSDAASPTSGSTHVQDVLQFPVTTTTTTTTTTAHANENKDADEEPNNNKKNDHITAVEEDGQPAQADKEHTSATHDKPAKRVVRGLVSSIRPDLLGAFMPPARRRTRGATGQHKAALHAMFQLASRGSSHVAADRTTHATTEEEKEEKERKAEGHREEEGTNEKAAKPQRGITVKCARKEQAQGLQQQQRQPKRTRRTKAAMRVAVVAEAQALGRVAAAEKKKAEEEVKEGNKYADTCDKAKRTEKAAAATTAAVAAEETLQANTPKESNVTELGQHQGATATTSQQRRPFPLLLLDPEGCEGQATAAQIHTTQDETTQDMVCAQREPRSLPSSNKRQPHEEEKNDIKGNRNGQSATPCSSAAHGTPAPLDEACAAAGQASQPQKKDKEMLKECSVMRADSRAARRLTEFVSNNTSEGQGEEMGAAGGRHRSPTYAKRHEEDKTNAAHTLASSNNNNNEVDERGAAAFAACEGSHSARVRRLMREFNILAHGIALVQECQAQVRSLLLELLADGDM